MVVTVADVTEQRAAEDASAEAHRRTRSIIEWLRPEAGATIMLGDGIAHCIKLAGDVYQIDYLPMKLAYGDFVLIVSATLLLSFLATIVPARRAGSLAPVDVLRYE